MLKTIVTKKENTILLSECGTKNGYAFKGKKGIFILADTTHNDYAWVRLTPGKLTKPVNDYSTIEDAITDKINAGYEVVAFETLEDLLNL